MPWRAMKHAPFCSTHRNRGLGVLSQRSTLCAMVTSATAMHPRTTTNLVVPELRLILQRAVVEGVRGVHAPQVRRRAPQLVCRLAVLDVDGGEARLDDARDARGAARVGDAGQGVRRDGLLPYVPVEARAPRRVRPVAVQAERLVPVLRVERGDAAQVQGGQARRVGAVADPCRELRRRVQARAQVRVDDRVAPAKVDDCREDVGKGGRWGESSGS